MELALILGLTRERVQLHEELSLQEGALREILQKRIQEVEELKRAQQLRVDEISVQKLRESYDTIQRLNSQMHELQERVNCMNDSRYRVEHSGKFLIFPVNEQSFQVFDLC